MNIGVGGTKAGSVTKLLKRDSTSQGAQMPGYFDFPVCDTEGMDVQQVSSFLFKSSSSAVLTKKQVLFRVSLSVHPLNFRSAELLVPLDGFDSFPALFLTAALLPLLTGVLPCASGPLLVSRVNPAVPPGLLKRPPLCAFPPFAV